MAPEEGYFRIVFLAPPSELEEVFRAMSAFTDEFLTSASGSRLK
jgi:aspartate/methionine/tyrosine aminotransferase